MNPLQRRHEVRLRGLLSFVPTGFRRAIQSAGWALAAGIAAVALAPAVSRAQAVAYRRAPGDTVRYREVTTGTVEARQVNGSIVSVTTRHDARIAVAFAAGDTARAWYEALELEASGILGQPDRRPDTAPLLRQPFTLVITPRGEVETVSTPAFPADVAQVTDLSAQFTDFFPRLPAGPLAPGVTWADTVSHETTDAAGRTVLAQRFGSYRVRGDSTVVGERVTVVELRTESEIITGSATPRSSGATMQSSLKGEETGIFLFAAASGRLVERRRSGRLAGTITVSGGGRTLSIPQSYRYESRIELVR